MGPIALILTAALLAVGMLALEVAPAGAGPLASTAKKKKKAIKKATKFIAGAGLTRTTVSSGATSSSSVTTQIAFCRNGTYGYKKQNDSSIAASQTTFTGNWKVVSATATTAKIQSTVTSFNSVYYDGSPGPDSPPPSPFTVSAQAASTSQVFLDGLEFTRYAGAAGC